MTLTTLSAGWQRAGDGWEHALGFALVPVTDLSKLWGREQVLRRSRQRGLAAAASPPSLAAPVGSAWRLDLPSVPYALTPAGVALFQGVRQTLVEAGAEAYDPGSQEWDPGHDAWLFVFAQADVPAFDPRTATPRPLGGRGWLQAAPGLWVHPAADAVFWARRHTVYARWPIGLYSLTWSAQQPEFAAVTRLRRRLEKVATNETNLTEAPAGYVARQYDWWRQGKRPPLLRP